MAGSNSFVNFGYTGFAGWLVGDPDAVRDPLGVMATPDYGLAGPVPPVPAGRSATPTTAAARAATGSGGAARGDGGWALEVPEGRSDWKSRDERRRAAALRGWAELLALDPGASVLSRQAADARDEGEAADSLKFAFAAKATSTLEGRLSSMSLFSRWARGTGADSYLPTREDIIFDYVRTLEAERAPATRAQAFLESVRFARGVAGLEVDLAVVLSGRVTGAALASADRKRVLVKCDPLPAAAVAFMELRVAEAKDPVETVMLGGFLFAVHARLRYGDLVRINVEPGLDVESGQGFIETIAHSELTKSGQAAKRRRRAVPVAGLAYGLLGAPWAEAWLYTRHEEGLDAAIDGTLMPARARGGWTRASPDIAEANAMLRAFIAEHAPTQSGGKFGTHSCKATLLSWSAKSGMKGELRRILCGHAKPKEQMVLEYSRDSLAAPLAALDRVMLQIRSGKFDPDASRSGRWGAAPPLHERLGVACPAADRPAGAGTDDQDENDSAETPDFNSESASPSPERSASEGAAPELAPPEATRQPGQAGGDGADLAHLGLVLFTHAVRKRRTLHAARRDDTGDGERLVCGLLRCRAAVVEDLSSVQYEAVCLRCLRGSEL